MNSRTDRSVSTCCVKLFTVLHSSRISNTNKTLHYLLQVKNYSRSSANTFSKYILSHTFAITYSLLMRKTGTWFKSTETQLKGLKRQKCFYKTCIIYLRGVLKHAIISSGRSRHLWNCVMLLLTS